MKKIGSGLQFNVYDLGNGKVLKKPKKRFEMYLKNLKWEPYLIFTPWILKQNINQAIKDKEFSLNYFKNNIHKSLLANLEFKEKEIFQDKVIPLKNILGKNINRDKVIINKYSDFIVRCWKEGFADKIYNFTLNNGIDKKGDICLIDFGEITINKEDIKKDILSKRWKKAGCYLWRLKGNSKKYYRQKMQETLTLNNLDKYWKVS